MRFLRDFYYAFPPRDRAVLWVAIALTLALGLTFSALLRWKPPAVGSAPLTAPAAWLQFAGLREQAARR